MGSDSAASQRVFSYSPWDNPVLPEEVHKCAFTVGSHKKRFFSLCLFYSKASRHHVLHSRDVTFGQPACSSFSGYPELLFALISSQDPGKVQLHFFFFRALFKVIAVAVFPSTCAMNQPVHIHHNFQDTQEETMEQIRISLCFLTTFIAEVWEKRGSSSETWGSSLCFYRNFL